MIHRHYLGGICGSEGRYGIVFPDFPGCVSAGETIDHVVAMGREALQVHIDGMVEDGDPIPEPTPVDFARLDREFVYEGEQESWVAVVAIEATIPDLPATINVSITSDLVREIAERVQRTADGLDGVNTRYFIEQAARRELDRLKKSA